MKKAGDISALGEFGLIRHIRTKFSRTSVHLGIGDDCAVVKEGRKFLLYTVDNVVDKVHFDTAIGMSWRDAGFRAVVRAVSDIAAMGGVPRHMLVSLMLPEAFKSTDLRKLLAGMKAASDKCGTGLIGGDVTSSETAVISVVAIGESFIEPVVRSGACAGDLIFVSGRPGTARIGFEMLKNSRGMNACVKAFLRPVARVELGRALLVKNIPTAMIDLSDGLLGDLHHILESSGKGAVIEKKRLILPQCAGQAFDTEKLNEYVLNGGDDYELLFTAPAEKRRSVAALSAATGIALTEIGVITGKKGVVINDKAGKVAVRASSYEHFRR